MSDLSLYKNLQRINRRGDGTKLSLLEELKNRISTDLLMAQLNVDKMSNPLPREQKISDDLEFVNSCINVYETMDGNLTPEAMVTINKINKRYRRV